VFGELSDRTDGAMQTVSRFERELEPTPSVNLPPIIRDFQDEWQRRPCRDVGSRLLSASVP